MKEQLQAYVNKLANRTNQFTAEGKTEAANAAAMIVEDLVLQFGLTLPETCYKNADK